MDPEPSTDSSMSKDDKGEVEFNLLQVNINPTEVEFNLPQVSIHPAKVEFNPHKVNVDTAEVDSNPPQVKMSPPHMGSCHTPQVLALSF